MHPPSPHNPQFYSVGGAFPGTPRPQAAAGPPIGSHNQFTPLQVGLGLGLGLRVGILTALLLPLPDRSPRSWSLPRRTT